MNDSWLSLSVIVPNYNNERYIKCCVESILQQTYKNLEILIADDCSGDSSPDIIREYEKRYPGVIRGQYHDENRGVSYNRHSAILAARGEYITTLDSDDYYFDVEKLRKEMELVQHYREVHGKDICAFSNIVFVDQDKNVISRWGTKETIREGKILYDIISRQCMIPRDFVMSRRGYFSAGGYDIAIDLYEDWDLKIRLSAAHEFYYTGIDGTAYRMREVGLSSASVDGHLDGMERVFKKNIGLVAPEDRKHLAALLENCKTQLQHSVVN